MNDLLTGGRIHEEQTVNGLSCHHGLRDYLGSVLRLHPQIAYLIRMNDHDWPFLTEPMTTSSPNIHLAAHLLFLELLLKCGADLLATGCLTTGSRTHCDAGLLCVSF